MYNELLDYEIIPEIKQESSSKLSVEELEQIVEKLKEEVSEYDRAIEKCEVGRKCKVIRSKRKYPKQALKRFLDFMRRKQKHQRDMEIFGERNSYSKTAHDATFIRMKDL